MNQGPDEQLNTPLEDALLSLPQEEAPADLQGKCLTALEEASLKTGARPRWEAWRQFAAAAAVLVMIIGAGNLGWVYLNSHSREKARAPQAMRMAKNFPIELFPAAPGSPAAPMPPPPMTGAPSGGSGGPSMAGGPGAAMESGGPAGPPTSRDKITQLPGKPTTVQGWFGQAPPQVKKRLAQESRQPSGVRSTAAYERDAQKPADAAAPASPSYNGWAGGARPTQPWENQSDTRRKVTERTVELETPNVEETYKQAVTLIEKSGGYVTQEGLTIRRQGGSGANIEARIPVAQFDGVIAQVRELGRLVVMTGQSQDETEEYQSQGAGIRTLGAREEELAARYNRETDQQKKAQVGRELASVRGQLGAEKQSLKSLHKSTSYAQLSLTITEARGLRAIVKNAAEQALPLAFSLALIMVPLLVLALLWKRRR